MSEWRLRSKVFLASIVLGAIVVTALVAMGPRYVGGAFDGPPESLGEISDGAKALMASAYADLDVNKLHDYHTHVVGLGAGGTGAEVNPHMLSWANPIARLKFDVYLSASGVSELAVADQRFVERLVKLVHNSPHPMTHHIFGFDRYYRVDGTTNAERTEFYVPNEYVLDLAEQHDNFEAVASVHPYKQGAAAELEALAKRGVRFVKWLPNAQGIDPSHEKCDPYYDVMKRYDMTLISHAGEEQAVKAEEDQKLGNPLLLRRALDKGVRVVVAHCASLGESEDLDNPGEMATAFELFMRLMENPKYKENLYGEISAVTQFNRLGDPLNTLLKRVDLHPRLVNGSDYPLPAINVLVSTMRLEQTGLITAEERSYLNEIYARNPLLFDFVTKRTLRHPETGTGFSPSVFEKRFYLK